MRSKSDDLTPVEAHALKMVLEGAESRIRDGVGGGGVLSDADRELAVGLAYDLLQVIERNRFTLMDLVAGLPPGPDTQVPVSG